jgi:adenylate cyclase
MGRELDVVRVQGKQEPVAIYQIMGRITDPSAFDEPLGIYRKALACYRNRNWSDASTLFTEVENRWPGDPPACLYLQRCRELLDNPPGMAWNHITTLDRKYKI